MTFSENENFAQALGGRSTPKQRYLRQFSSFHTLYAGNWETDIWGAKCLV